jgi:hypothetical protein
MIKMDKLKKNYKKSPLCLRAFPSAKVSTAGKCSKNLKTNHENTKGGKHEIK